jgi:3-oxoadipate enol-lactonase
VTLHHEIKGSGPPVVFLHPGLADSRVWDPQWTSFAPRYQLVRCDLPGFGRTPLGNGTVELARDVTALLDQVGVPAATIIGCSLGGRVALEVALARPELVSSLVLVGAGLPGYAWSETVRESRATADEAVSRGDLDAATEINLRMWVDGPNRKPAEVDPSIRAAVAEMQRDALKLQAPYWDDVTEKPLVPELSDRLGDVRIPTLVLFGEEDVEDIHRLAEILAAAIPDATLASIPGAAHVPNLEQPAAFDALVLDFLATVGPGASLQSPPGTLSR